MLATKIAIFTNRIDFTIGKDRTVGSCYYGENNDKVNSAPMARKQMGNSIVSGDVPFNGDHDTITPIQLNKILLKTNYQGVILDLRDSRHFQNGRIKGAKSANCTTKLMSRKTVLDWKRCEFTEENHFLLYDQHSDMPATNSPQMVLIEHLIQNNKKITFLQGGFDEFKKICSVSLIETSLSKEKLQCYNHSPTNVHINNSEDVLNATASQILPFLVIGNERDSSDLDLLKDMGITHILNVTSTSPFYFKHLNGFQYQRVPACDSHLQNLRILYNDAFRFIDDARHSGGRILVHCWAGVSRSPSIVIAYLLKHSNCDLHTILQFVQAKRDIVAPNIHFMGQLEKYSLDLNHNLEKKCVDLFDKEFRDEY